MKNEVFSQQHFIRTLLDGQKEISNGEVLVRQRALGLDYLVSPYLVADVAPDYSSTDFAEKDSLIFSMGEYMKKRLTADGYLCFVVADSRSNFQLVLSIRGKDTKKLDEYFIDFRHRLLMEFGVDFFIGIGKTVVNLRDVCESASDAREMLGFRFSYADRGVININNLVPFRKSAMIGPNMVFEKVIESFESCNLGQMSLRIDELVEYVRRRPNVSKTSIRRTMIELMIRILNIASNAEIPVEDVLDGREPYNWILQQNHTEIIVEWIMQVSAELISRMKAQQENRVNATVKKACVYIEEHLSSQDLGLASVSDYAGLSASYFSQLFKNEMGVGLNNYISDLRIQRAKELLTKTNLTNEEISLQSGFSTVHYFSRVFGKSVGMTPGQYRKKEQQK